MLQDIEQWNFIKIKCIWNSLDKTCNKCYCWATNGYFLFVSVCLCVCICVFVDAVFAWNFIRAQSQSDIQMWHSGSGAIVCVRVWMYMWHGFVCYRLLSCAEQSSIHEVVLRTAQLPKSSALKWNKILPFFNSFHVCHIYFSHSFSLFSSMIK